MNLKQTPEFLSFLSTVILESEMDGDEAATRAFAAAAPVTRLEQVLKQAKALHGAPELPLDEFGSEANRWFGDQEEAREWLGRLITVLEAVEAPAGAAIVVKDSNGTPLSEGDSVLVIKDLKVKGGSSDLKRGTMIRKIHLVDDAEVVECRVDGSTLVLKTCFLKKA